MLQRQITGSLRSNDVKKLTRWALVASLVAQNQPLQIFPRSRAYWLRVAILLLTTIAYFGLFSGVWGFQISSIAATMHFVLPFQAALLLTVATALFVGFVADVVYRGLKETQKQLNVLKFDPAVAGIRFGQVDLIDLPDLPDFESGTIGRLKPTQRLEEQNTVLALLDCLKLKGVDENYGSFSLLEVGKVIWIACRFKKESVDQGVNPFCKDDAKNRILRFLDIGQADLWSSQAPVAGTGAGAGAGAGTLPEAEPKLKKQYGPLPLPRLAKRTLDRYLSGVPPKRNVQINSEPGVPGISTGGVPEHLMGCIQALSLSVNLTQGQQVQEAAALEAAVDLDAGIQESLWQDMSAVHAFQYAKDKLWDDEQCKSFTHNWFWRLSDAFFELSGLEKRRDLTVNCSQAALDAMLNLKGRLHVNGKLSLDDLPPGMYFK